MNGQQLKNSILQMAVQGKLVPQDPNDEPASVLIQRIREEKEKLIKEKKIKKEKNPSYIFRGSDNLHYEKIGDAEPVCIEEQLPFEIPNTWEWARISSIGYMVRGKGIKRTEIVDHGFPCIRYGEIYTSYNISFTDALSHVEESIYKSCNHISNGDIVMTLTGENKPDIAKAIVYLGDGNIAAGGDLAYWTRHGMSPLYLVFFMASPYCIEQKRRTATGDIIVHISTEKIGSFFIPIPPLAEQQRIVAKIEQILPHIREYELSESRIGQLNAAFPEQLKKSILQEAVQGKLVPQDPNDEPASILLEKIAKEKEKLIKEGKIKKQKSLPPITEDEIPFEIPDSWEWVRLNKIVTLLGDGIHGTPLYDPKGNNYFINGTNIKNDRIIITDNTKLVSDEEALKHSRTLCDNTLLVSINGTLGNVAYYKGENIVLGKSVCYFNLLYVYKYYIGLFLKSFYVQEYLKKSATGSTIKNVPLSSMRSMLVPIPPIGEQKRIVAKIEELMPLIDNFNKA